MNILVFTGTIITPYSGSKMNADPDPHAWKFSLFITAGYRYWSRIQNEL